MNDLLLHMIPYWNITLIEVLGFVLSLLAIWLAARNKVATWPLQVISSLIYVYLFYVYALPGEATLNFIYCLLALYGWWGWRPDSPHHRAFTIQRMTRQQWLAGLVLGTMATGVLAQWQFKLGITDLPVLDSGVFVFGLIAQYLQARRLLGNWLWWVVIDLVSAGIYGYKGLYITAVLYVIFTVLAVQGWRTWRRQLAIRL